MKDKVIFNLGRIRLSWAWYDVWMGAYLDVKGRKLYLCLLPTLLLTIDFSLT